MKYPMEKLTRAWQEGVNVDIRSSCIPGAWWWNLTLTQREPGHTKNTRKMHSFCVTGRTRSDGPSLMGVSGWGWLNWCDSGGWGLNDDLTWRWCQRWRGWWKWQRYKGEIICWWKSRKQKRVMAHDVSPMAMCENELIPVSNVFIENNHKHSDRKKSKQVFFAEHKQQLTAGWYSIPLQILMQHPVSNWKVAEVSF